MTDRDDGLYIGPLEGLSGFWKEVPQRYSYAADKCKCPVCPGIGFPWAGWFGCQMCPCKAMVSDGRAFIPCDGDELE